MGQLCDWLEKLELFMDDAVWPPEIVFEIEIDMKFHP